MQAAVQRALHTILIQDLFLDIDPDRLAPEDPLATVCGLDSIGFLELRIRCEEHFGVEISDEDFSSENFSSIASLSRLLERLNASAPANAANSLQANRGSEE